VSSSKVLVVILRNLVKAERDPMQSACGKRGQGVWDATRSNQFGDTAIQLLRNIGDNDQTWTLDVAIYVDRWRSLTRNMLSMAFLLYG